MHSLARTPALPTGIHPRALLKIPLPPSPPLLPLMSRPNSVVRNNPFVLSTLLRALYCLLLLVLMFLMSHRGFVPLFVVIFLTIIAALVALIYVFTKPPLRFTAVPRRLEWTHAPAPIKLSRSVSIIAQRSPEPLPKDISRQRYTNSFHRYSFEYLPSMEVIECNPSLVYVVPAVRAYDPCSSGVRGFVMSISVEPSGTGYRLADWYYRDYVINEIPVTLDSQIGKKFTGTRTASDPAPIPPRVDIIVLRYLGSNFIIEAPLDEIVSTFRFIP